MLEPFNAKRQLWQTLMAVSHWNTGPAAARFRFKKKQKRARASEPASERASKRLRKVREQASVDVPPVVRGQRRDFTNVGEQAKDRGALIKFYGATAGGLA